MTKIRLTTAVFVALNFFSNPLSGQDLNVNGNIFLPSYNGMKQIYTWHPTDANWRIGMSTTPGFSTSMATSHVQYLTYHNSLGQGFAVGVNGGQSSFEITGGNHNAFFRGNVGIGITTPGSKLHIDGGHVYVGPLSGTLPGAGRIAVSGTYAEVSFSNRSISSFVESPTLGERFVIYNDGTASDGKLRFWSNGDKMTLTKEGNVGIGTTNPNQKLTVNGTIYGKEVKVDLSVPGPDYVFADNYQLPTLNELKTYIDQHKHLPEVPSAKEMEANGINLGEMNMMLLKKIEELTLYLLQKDEEILTLKKDIKSIKSKIYE